VRSVVETILHVSDASGSGASAPSFRAIDAAVRPSRPKRIKTSGDTSNFMAASLGVTD
jgi:hypothetical protein